MIAPTELNLDKNSSSRWFLPVLIALPVMGMLLIVAYQFGRINEVQNLTKTFTPYIQTVNDFGGLRRYQPVNDQVNPPEPNEQRVVFFGDSITDFWLLPRYFPGKRYINRGISGQTTAQMLVRFKQDVLYLHPSAVVILAGVNDIAGNTGPMTVEQTEGNIETMAELAYFHGIHVVICSILPVSKTIWSAEKRAKIVRLNTWLQNYADTNHYPYVDYYDAMKDRDSSLPERLSLDGIHPLPGGYSIMAPLAESAIEDSLKEEEQR